MRLKKSMSILIAISMLVSNIPIVMAKEEAVKIPSRSIYTHKEIIGKDRYETGRKVLEESKRYKNIIVVNGSEEKLVDGLCASGLVEKLNATILPINPKKVDKKSMEYINKAENVYIIGEKQAIPYSFEKSINKKVKVVRIGGKDRYETSEKIAKYIGSYDKAYLVNGAIGHPDAMSISSVAAKEKSPIILTKKDSSKAEKKKGVEYTAIGGTSVISNSLVSKYSAKRIGGETRYETNRMVLNKYYPNSSIRYFTNGETLVDALSAASISKNNGITFINRHKNHDLLEYIDTVQVGGFPYDVVFVNNGTGTGGSGGTVVPPSKPENIPPTSPAAKAIVEYKKFDTNEKKYPVKIQITTPSTDPDGDSSKITYEYRYKDDKGNYVIKKLEKDKDGYYPIGNYPVGSHEIEVRATDGNKGGESAWVKVEIDANQAPTAPTGLDVVINRKDTKEDSEGNKYYKVTSIIAKGSNDIDGNDNEIRYEYEGLSKDGYYKVGENTITVKAIDKLGKESSSVSLKFLVKQNNAPLEPEVEAIVEYKKFDKDKKEYPVKIHITTPSTDEDEDEITYEYKYEDDKGNVVIKKLEKDKDGYYPIENYPVGEYEIEVRAVDGFGGESAWVKVEIDANQAPTAPTGLDVVINKKDTKKDSEGNKYYKVESITAKGSNDPDGDSSKITYKYEGLSKDGYYKVGKNTINVIAIDELGKKSSPVPLEFSVELNNGPTIPKVKHEVHYYEKIMNENKEPCYKVVINAESTDPDGDSSKITYKYEYKGEDGEYHPVKEYYPEGRYKFRVVAVDEYGEESKPSEFDLTIELPEAVLKDGFNFNTSIKNITGFNEKVTKIKFVETEKKAPDKAEALDDYRLINAYINPNDETELIIASEYTIYANNNSPSMFKDFSNITNIEFDNFDTKYVTSMINMFDGCTSLTGVNLVNCSSPENITIDMSNMFFGCTNLTNVNLGKLKSNNMSNMFNGCKGLTSIDLKEENISQVKNMSNTFNGCTGLTTVNITPVEGFNFVNLETMSNMFKGCTSLTSVNLGNCSSTNTINMGDMFYGCTNLTNVNLGKFKINSMLRMFSGNTKITSIDLSTLDTTNVTNMQEMFSGCEGLTTVNMTIANNFESLTTMSSMFLGCTNLTTVDLGNCSSTNKIIMNNMFTGCKGLTTVNLGNLKSGSMLSMFSGCTGLTSINLKEENISQTESMQTMFSGCTGLTTVNIISKDSSINFDRLTTMLNMFAGCTSLTNIDFNNCSSTNTINMDDVFTGCTSLINAKLGGLRARNMYHMFNGCTSLTSVDLSEFDASKATYMNEMFKGCSTLTTLTPEEPTNFGRSGCKKINMFGDSNKETKLPQKVIDAYLKSN